MEIELVGVPFDGYGRAGHQARAAAALREAGLVTRSPVELQDGGDLVLPGSEDQPGRRSGWLNEPALEALTAGLRARVAGAAATGRRALVVGGDCSALLGIVAGLRADDHPVGLLFVDGHEDTMPLDVVEDGEAANCELGVLLGLTGRLLRGPLAETRGLLGLEDLCVVGPRDESWRRRFNVGSLGDLGVWTRGLALAREDPAATGRRAAERLAARTGRWWLHVDLDVLDPEVFTAQGLPDYPDDPDGLLWQELTELATSAVTVPGCLGVSLAIYDPDQDPTRAEADRVVGLAHTVLRHLAP